jgi:hypothetical protein
MLIREFFEFMRKREQIRLNRAAGLPREEWTDDEILRTYKFTNVKREHDRMTKFFLKIYKSMNFFSESGDWQDRCELFMTCAIFRYFGTEKSAEVLGTFSWANDEDDGNGNKFFTERIPKYGLQNDLTFTGAYIVPNCGDPREKYLVVADILEGIWKVHENVVEAISGPESQKRMKDAVDLLTSCWGCGSFMAKEILLDYVLATGEKPSDWTVWTPIGPGARRGAARVASADGSLDRPLSEPKALEVAKDLYDAYRQVPMTADDMVWPTFTEIAGSTVRWVELDLCDIQFQLCEFDKYMRAKSGDGKPKKLFVPRTD